jgi:hypothetical protein
MAGRDYRAECVQVKVDEEIPPQERNVQELEIEDMQRQIL